MPLPEHLRPHFEEMIAMGFAERREVPLPGGGTVVLWKFKPDNREPGHADADGP